MGRFTKIPQNTFQELQVDAGVLLKNFDPANPAVPSESDFICATTGGVNPSCVAEYEDWGEDIDNCPNNTKELKRLTGWTCTISTTCLGVSPETIKLALGAADVSGTDHVTPRASLAQADFTNELWWVGDKSDGGAVAVCLKNVLSTGGFSLQTTKKGKGQVALELTGHVSINDQDTVPMDFYLIT